MTDLHTFYSLTIMWCGCVFWNKQLLYFYRPSRSQFHSCLHCLQIFHIWWNCWRCFLNLVVLSFWAPRATVWTDNETETSHNRRPEIHVFRWNKTPHQTQPEHSFIVWMLTMLTLELSDYYTLTLLEKTILNDNTQKSHCAVSYCCAVLSSSCKLAWR